jgi:hypothetical protein
MSPIFHPENVGRRQKNLENQFAERAKKMAQMILKKF